MILLQVFPVATEPYLTTGAVVGIGGVVVWFANRINRIYDWTRDLRQLVIGHPDGPKPGGLMAVIEKHDEYVRVSDARMNSLWAGFDDTARRVKYLEDLHASEHHASQRQEPT